MRKLRATMTTDANLKDLLSVLWNDSQGFITELFELLSSQYDEYVESSSFIAEEAWSLVIDCVAHTSEELYYAQSGVMDAGQYNQGIQERYK